MYHTWFSKNKKEKVKEKKKRKKGSESSSGKEDNSSLETKDSNSVDISISPPNSDDNPKIDSEGYIIRQHFANQSIGGNGFYSSSDSDSETDEKSQKIQIKINPITNGTPISASVDELIASANTLSLFPINNSRRRPEALNIRLKNRRIYTKSSFGKSSEDGPIKRSFSANHNISRTDNDLITVFCSSKSSASTPVAGITDQNNSKCIKNINNYENNILNKSPDRYAALSDLFNDATVNNNQPKDNKHLNLSKSVSATILGPPSIMSIPRPPSKRNNQTSPQLSNQSSISRCQSVSSISCDFRMTPISVSSSRGPSPLTLAISDVVPIAVALQESVSACFKGNDETRCQVHLIGNVKIAFPPGIVQAFASNPHPSPLTFNLNKSSKIDKIFPNKELLNENLQNINSDKYSFEVNMPSLMLNIRRLYEQSPNSRYYNIDILKYQIKTLNGAKSAPLHLVSYWKCDPQTTKLKIDYKYNSNALSNFEALKNVSFTVNIDGAPYSMQSRPEGKWNALSKQASWRFDQISRNTDIGGLGSVKAKFDLTAGPTNPTVIQAQFLCDTTLSGVEFELTGFGYRVSLVKKQLSSGRYICEAGFDPESNNYKI